MQQGQTPAKGCLVAATKIQPRQQQHRTVGQCCQSDGLRHNQERGIGLGMQGLKGLRLYLKQGQRAGATAFGKQHRDGFIGAGPQPGGWRDDWGSAFVELRLRPQLEALDGLQQDSTDLNPLLLRLAEHLNEHQPHPALVHGDLWGGNAASLSDGRGSIFDPASWWADREVDLAMTRLFGGFGEAFRSGYREVIPEASGADGRVEIYNLYHLLNHANLFGGSYLSQCRASLRELARRF